MTKKIHKNQITRKIRKNSFSIGGFLTSTVHSISNIFPHQVMPNMGMDLGLKVVGGVTVVTAGYYGVTKANKIITTRWSEYASPKWAISLTEEIIQEGDRTRKLDKNGKVWQTSLEGVNDRIVLPDGNIITRIETCKHWWGSLVRNITKDYNYGYEYKYSKEKHLDNKIPAPSVEIAHNGNINVVMYSYNSANEISIIDKINNFFPNPTNDLYHLRLMLSAKVDTETYAKLQGEIDVFVNQPLKTQETVIANLTVSQKLNLMRSIDQLKTVTEYNMRYAITREMLKKNIETSPLAAQLPMMMPEAKDDRFHTESSNNF